MLPSEDAVSTTFVVETAPSSDPQTTSSPPIAAPAKSPCAPLHAHARHCT